jgi:hypothetical protein
MEDRLEAAHEACGAMNPAADGITVLGPGPVPEPLDHAGFKLGVRPLRMLAPELLPHHRDACLEKLQGDPKPTRGGLVLGVHPIHCTGNSPPGGALTVSRRPPSLHRGDEKSPIEDLRPRK